MQRLGLSQIMTQKLSPQQIQFIKLLQIPTAELDSRIEEELEVNPALEEGKEEDGRHRKGQRGYPDGRVLESLEAKLTVPMIKKKTVVKAMWIFVCTLVIVSMFASTIRL